MNLHMKTAASVASLAGAFLLLPAFASAAPTPLVAPVIPGVAQLPGPIAPASKPSATMGTLKTSPDIAVAGTKFTITGTGLPANKAVTITWGTAKVTWVVDARPDSVDYLGRQADKLTVVLAQTATDGSGKFVVALKAPKDFGGIHDLYAVVDGVQVAKGGFLIDRSATISPKSGPIGTMLTVTYTGLGSSLYEGGASLLYDNKYVGAMMANWTRGVAVAHIRASGPVGRHTIEAADAISFKYLNIQQSPIPWGTGYLLSFNVTKDNGRPKDRIDWPANVAPTLDAKTTLQLASASAGSVATASARVHLGRGQLAGRHHRERPDPEHAGRPRVGNRRRQPRQLHRHVLGVRLGSARDADHHGCRLARRQIKVPDGLGGWHVVQLIQNGQTKAQVAYFVKRSIVGNGVSSFRLKAGQRFTVHLKGLGWTQLDNTIAVDYDNSYVGYGCGFNSQGDTVMNLVATGAPWYASHRHVPAALHAAAFVREHALRDDPCAHVREGCTGPRARLHPAGDPPGDHDRQVDRVEEGRGLRPPSLRQPPVPAAEDRHQRRDEDHPHDRHVDEDRQREAERRTPAGRRRGRRRSRRTRRP